jgi:hypothetical protein
MDLYFNFLLMPVIVDSHVIGKSKLIWVFSTFDRTSTILPQMSY